MKLLELFSGTHSIGKVAKKYNIDVVSLDKDLNDECPFGSGYKSDYHIQKDIMEWDYKKDFKVGDFDIITASPVCLWWSHLRGSWVGRKFKNMDRALTREDIQNDIEKYGIPMIEKVFEIIDFFKPKYYWIENPQTGKMKDYINDLIPFYDVDYCKYSDYGYKKRTRFWTNIENFEPKLCKNDCSNMIEIETTDNDYHSTGSKIKSEKRLLHKNVMSFTKQKAIKNHFKNKKCNMIHKKSFGSKNKNQLSVGGGSNRLERYRIPTKLIEELLDKCI